MKQRPVVVDFYNVEDDIVNALNKFREKQNYGFITDPLSEKKKQDIELTGIDYVLNSENFRCDQFTNIHKDKHILFAGCSNTFGEGINYKNTWAYRLYKEISNDELLTGYFNLGATGASIFEILVNVNRYIRKYSMPNTIFLLFPEVERDIRYFVKPEVALTTLIAEMYNQLEFLCKQSNTLLISTSWINMDEELIAKKYSELYSQNIDVKTENGKYADIGFYQHLKSINPYKELSLLEKYTKTFKVLKQKDIDYNVYDYYVKNKEKNVFVAPDSGGHHGEGFHYAWFKYFYERYKYEKNNI